MTSRPDIKVHWHNTRFTWLHISKLPHNISTCRPGIKVHRHNILSYWINIKVLQDILMIGHNIRLGRLHICQVPLNILTNGPSRKSHRHNILSRAISIMTVYRNKFINAHNIKILQLNIWHNILLFWQDINLVHIRQSRLSIRDLSSEDKHACLHIAWDKEYPQHYRDSSGPGYSLKEIFVSCNNCVQQPFWRMSLFSRVFYIQKHLKKHNFWLAQP